MTTHSRRNSLPTLWEQAVQLWKDLVLGFGHPHLLMRWGWMRALYHRALGHELRELEKIVRRAIRADAEELELPPLKPLRKRGKRPPPQSGKDMANGDMPSYGDDSATWKVCFRMSAFPPGKHRSPRRNKKPSEQRPCRNYALRIEALRRVLWRREDYARRYALRLARIEEARLRIMAGHIAEAQAMRGAHEEFLSALSTLLGPPEDEDAGLMTFNVAPPNAKLIEPG
jgi:hypothetical protein